MSMFHHLNPKKLAAVLLAAKTGIDNAAKVDPKAFGPWVSQFDTSAQAAITALGSWTTGSPTTEITEALTAAVGVLQGVEGLSPQDQLLIAGFSTAAESTIALL